MENKNLTIYEKVKTVPEEAKKQITGGRLKGMTDIKPMWRIEKLTEIFGPAGLGWYTKTINKEIIDGANNEKIAVVDIELYVNYKQPLGLEEDLWSKAIEGSGGSSFISNEKNGLYTSDECFKMAYTDALSVACKALGMGADVYWGDSKYQTNNQEDEQKQTTKKVTSKATPNQLAILNKLTEEDKQKIYAQYNVTTLEELTVVQASEVIGRIKKGGSK